MSRSRPRSRCLRDKVRLWRRSTSFRSLELGRDSTPRAAAARCPPAATPPSPPDLSPPTDSSLPRTVRTAPARSPPAPPVQSSLCSYHSPEYKIFLPVERRASPLGHNQL